MGYFETRIWTPADEEGYQGVWQRRHNDDNRAYGLNDYESAGIYVATPEPTEIIVTVTPSIFSDTSGADVDASVARFSEIVEEQLRAEFANEDVTIEVRTSRGQVLHATQVFTDGTPGMEEQITERVDAVMERVLSGDYGEWVVEATDANTRDVSAHGDHVPDVGDDAAWAQYASEHAPDCEWTTTRAHRI